MDALDLVRKFGSDDCRVVIPVNDMFLARLRRQGNPDLKAACSFLVLTWAVKEIP